MNSATDFERRTTDCTDVQNDEIRMTNDEERGTRIDANHGRVLHKVLWNAERPRTAFRAILGSIQSDTRTCRTPKASRNRAEMLAFLFAFIRVIRGQTFGCGGAALGNP